MRVLLPLHKILTVDDDLVGTREIDLQWKKRIPRKAQNECHVDDDIAYSSFNFVVVSRFGRRGEGKDTGARVTIECLLGDEWEKIVSSLMVTAKGWYGLDEFQNYLRGKGKLIAFFPRR